MISKGVAGFHQIAIVTLTLFKFERGGWVSPDSRSYTDTTLYDCIFRMASDLLDLADIKKGSTRRRGNKFPFILDRKINFPIARMQGKAQIWKFQIKSNKYGKSKYYILFIYI